MHRVTTLPSIRMGRAFVQIDRMIGTTHVHRHTFCLPKRDGTATVYSLMRVYSHQAPSRATLSDPR